MIGVFKRQDHSALFQLAAVVGVVQLHHQPAVVQAVGVILQGHLQGHFHTHAARVGEEAIIQVAGEKLLQLGRQLLHRVVGQAAQHHVAELARLLLDGGGELRVLIAVDHTPPGGHRVDELLVLGVEIHAVGILDLIGGLHGLHLFIGVPNHFISPHHKAAPGPVRPWGIAPYRPAPAPARAARCAPGTWPRCPPPSGPPGGSG